MASFLDHLISRRRFLQASALLALSTTLPARFAFASLPGDQRLIVVILRGALDGLGAVIPYRDPHYMDARGSIATPLSADALIDLNGYFAFPKALEALVPLYTAKELLVLHATATPYRERSHFDAQDVLENGGATPHGLSTGWLNRTLGALGGSAQALALGPDIPLILRGGGNVTSWDPSPLPEVDADFLSRVAHMYEHDPVLSHALSQSTLMQQLVGTEAEPKNARSFPNMMAQAAKLMAAPTGPRLATIDVTGWDTHVNQGTDKGRLPNNLRILADGLNSLRTGLGAAWANTAVLVVTEFGRTVRGNGTNGTDHGTGTVAFLLGGNVAGGRVIGDWPGLATLYQDRDLTPANDLRALLKGTLAGHLAVNQQVLDQTIFPESASATAYSGLFKA